MEKTRLRIKQLDSRLINLIAAGEVISEPAMIVKELVENSVDARAKNIEITVLNAGRTLIRVKDDGHGIYKDDLKLAIERHATSKITSESLFEIPYLGFRGEALPSLAAVTNLTISSKVEGTESGYKLTCNFGDIGDIAKTTMNVGSVVSAAKLFYNIPARLKFLRSDRSEIYAINEVFLKMCLAHYKVNFSYNLDNKKRQVYISDKSVSSDQAIKKRIIEVLGREFVENSSYTILNDGGYRAEVFAAQPTFNASNSKSSYYFVNSRPVDDKLFFISAKLAYGDTIPKGRFARLVAYLTIPKTELDVNVHPAKSEVKFNYPQKVRKLLSEAIRQSIYKNSKILTSHYFQKIENKVLKNENNLEKRGLLNTHNSTGYKYYNPEPVKKSQKTDNKSNLKKSIYKSTSYQRSAGGFESNKQKAGLTFQAKPKHLISKVITKQSGIDSILKPQDQPIKSVNIGGSDQTSFFTKRKYGHPIAQVFNCYIITITDDGILLIDQHAAHERIVYEKLKSLQSEKERLNEELLIPYDINLASNKIEVLLKSKAQLSRNGFEISKTADVNKLKILSIPTILKSIFKKTSPSIFFDDLATAITENDTNNKVLEVIWAVCSKIACYGSVRSAKRLSQIEMEDLLDQMEVTPNSSQCNHGRPTYIKISLKDLESLFERS